MRWLFAALLLLCTGSARAAEPVDLTLVLVDDVSRSIDDSEFDMQKQGYAAAFTDPDVLAAIQGGANGSIAVQYIEFASSYEVKTIIDWSVIHDAASAKDFVQKFTAVPRSAWGRTAIGSGIEAAVKALENPPFQSARRVIDVCGDGTNNNGPEVSGVRDDAVEAGIIINGLAIINDHPVSWTYAHVQPPGGLDKYYRENVTGGTGSFVVTIHDFHSFADAIKRKLINEIAAAGTRRKPT